MYIHATGSSYHVSIKKILKSSACESKYNIFKDVLKIQVFSIKNIVTKGDYGCLSSNITNVMTVLIKVHV